MIPIAVTTSIRTVFNRWNWVGDFLQAMYLRFHNSVQRMKNLAFGDSDYRNFNFQSFHLSELQKLEQHYLNALSILQRSSDIGRKIGLIITTKTQPSLYVLIQTKKSLLLIQGKVFEHRLLGSRQGSATWNWNWYCNRTIISYLQA